MTCLEPLRASLASHGTESGSPGRGPVAVIGAGPGGLTAARWLKGQGFAPVLIEAHDDLGGQWNAANPLSGVWPSMRANTARMVTRFSDGDYPAAVPMFPHNGEVLAYLRAYAGRFGLGEGARFSTRLAGLAAAPEGGWRLLLDGPGGQTEETFPCVVVATGAFNRPHVPDVPGLGSFSGRLGAVHAFRYKEPDTYRGARVLVAGGNISALEVASDLAHLGVARVALAMRRQRYVLPRLIAGVPLESYSFTRARALWLERTSPDEWAAATRAFALRVGGNPAWYGAPEPHPDVRLAGTVGSHAFPQLVAEGRVACRPWIDRVDGARVLFADGTADEFDGLVLATGYRPDLPFLSGKLREALEVGPAGLTLAHHSLHPDAPGLAFVGLWTQAGAYFAPLEGQARWIAYAWAGTVPALSDGELRAALVEARAARGQGLFQHLQTIRFARLCGADPEGRVDESLAALLANTAVTAMTCRLVGPNALPEAEAAVRDEAHRFGRRDLMAPQPT